MTYAVIPNEDVAAGAPLSTALMTQLRDNADDVLVLLGTLTTTSGASQVLSGLDLTEYKEIHIASGAVGHDVSGDANLQLEGESIATGIADNDTADFYTVINLTYGGGMSAFLESGFSGSSGVRAVFETGISTATTSLTFAWTSGSFDAGEIKVWGLR